MLGRLFPNGSSISEICHLHLGCRSRNYVHVCGIRQSRQRRKCYMAPTDAALATVSWAHEQDPLLPLFTGTTPRRYLKSKLPFWLIVNTYIKEKGPLSPLKLFKHDSQSLYSKTKGRVDGSAQARAILQSYTSSLKWEQKRVSQTIKPQAVNSFIAWRMTQKRNLLESIV